jgi:hypothetical protein
MRFRKLNMAERSVPSINGRTGRSAVRRARERVSISMPSAFTLFSLTVRMPEAGRSHKESVVSVEVGTSERIHGWALVISSMKVRPTDHTVYRTRWMAAKDSRGVGLSRLVFTRRR